MPRFIVGVRELYDRDRVRGRWQGIDTGFGTSSQPVFKFSEHAAISTIEFADLVPGQEQGQVPVAGSEVDDSGAIRLEMLGDGTRQV